MRNYIIIVTLIIGSYHYCSGTAEAGEFVPWDFSRPAVKQVSDVVSLNNMSLPAHLLYEGTVFFSKYISPVDGDRCAMYPTCSSYSRQAIAKHGFILGFIMTADRLIHESNEIDTANLIRIGESYRYSDSVADNDFWWYQPH